MIQNTVNQNPEDGFLDVVKEVMEMVDVTVEEAVDRVRWRQTTCCGDP